MIRNNFLILTNLILIALSLWLFDVTNFDTYLQNHFFDFINKSWLIDAREPIKKFIFYIFPKILFGGVVIFCIFKAIKTKNEQRQKFIIIVTGLLLISLVSGNIKKFTNIYCPNQLEIYNGQYPYVKILQQYPADFTQEKLGKCFPAGHCITGFAFFILFFVLEKKRNRIFGLIGAFSAGWILGLYQMFKGAHFFSDTFISMLICFLLANLVGLFYQYRHQRKPN